MCCNLSGRPLGGYSGLLGTTLGATLGGHSRTGSGCRQVSNLGLGGYSGLGELLWGATPEPGRAVARLVWAWGGTLGLPGYSGGLLQNRLGLSLG